MKTILNNLVLAGIFGLSLISLDSCTKEQSDYQISGFGSILDVTAAGASSVLAENLEAVISETVVTGDEELDVLLHMKEEEKLARDVYSALNLKWNNLVFTNISRAENTHLNAIIFLLQNYGTDYTKVLDPGKFTIPEFEILYAELVSKGSVSIEEAWKVGALIEEMDIADLEESISKTADENTIIVFENLQKGSRNHLRAFISQLTALNATYTPTYLTAGEYNLIISTPNEKGNQYRMNGKANRNGRFGKRNCNL